MNREKTINLLGFLGTCLAIAMFVSLLEIARDNFRGESHIFIQPTVTTINCVIWSVYAYLKKEKFVFWANLPGVFLGIFTVITAFI
ncbi:hypothetical protein IT400_00960 [Candidatus Nomurabacteria bacterium]|nr:hypothetical protein [Candidatus Nomurabacteria bacterium]